MGLHITRSEVHETGANIRWEIRDTRSSEVENALIAISESLLSLAADRVSLRSVRAVSVTTIGFYYFLLAGAFYYEVLFGLVIISGRCRCGGN